MPTGAVSEERMPVRRFSGYRIIEHLALMVLFAVLSLTGLTQKFHASVLSQYLIVMMGGIDVVRHIHHAAGVLFTALVSGHILAGFAGIFLRKWAPSMLITVKDFQDSLQDMRYYLGMADRPASYGRYSYKEKFVYWLTLSGGVQLIITGFVLWFPVAATNYLPGQIIPISKVVHSSEAMLIFLMIAIWHSYDAIFNPEVFPLDKSIFTGYSEKPRAEGS